MVRSLGIDVDDGALVEREKVKMMIVTVLRSLQYHYISLSSSSGITALILHKRRTRLLNHKKLSLGPEVVEGLQIADHEQEGANLVYDRAAMLARWGFRQRSCFAAGASTLDSWGSWEIG